MAPDLASTFRPYLIFQEVVNNNRRPIKPEPGSEAYLICGFSDEMWEVMETCWHRDPSLRPSAPRLCELPAFVDVVDDRHSD